MNRNTILHYLFFLIFAIPLTYKNAAYCNIFLDLGFDGQYGILWNYMLSEGFVPFRDIFYPYGIFSYYSGFNFYTNITFYILYLTVICSFFYFIRKLFENKYISLFLGISFVWFLELYTGGYLVNRYGVALVFGLLCINRLVSKEQNKKLFLILGFINGIIFSFLGDSGIYSGLLFGFVYALTLFSKYRRNIFGILRGGIKSILSYCIGILIGLLPFFLYLYLTSSTASYIIFLKDISNLIDAWKSPLTPFLTSPDNIFTIIIFYVSSLYLSIKIVLKRRLTLSDWYQALILFFIFLLEHKSLIKSIDRQITFVSLFLSIVIISEILGELKKRSVKTFYLYSYLFLYLFFILLIYPFSNRPFLQSQNPDLFNKEVKTISECVDVNVRSVMGNSTYSDSKLISLLSSNSFYSFPGEPIWYVLTRSIPPRYVDTYTTSYKDAEDYMLRYLETQRPDYLLYNYTRFAFLDGVPDYMRVPNELKYILTHYIPVHKEKENLLMVRSDSLVDYFKSSMVVNDLILSDKLLNISLGNIPRSEGFHKISAENNFMFESTDKTINLTSINTKGIVLLVRHNKTDDEFSSINIKTQDGYETKIEYMNCWDEVCVIDFERIPLFYIPRNLTTIEFDTKNQKSFSIAKKELLPELW